VRLACMEERKKKTRNAYKKDKGMSILCNKKWEDGVSTWDGTKVNILRRVKDE